MQVSVENTGDLERRMTVQVPADEIDSQVAGRLNELRREVRLKGFRPGKVPLNVIRQRYGKQVRDEVMQQLMQSRLQDAIGEQKLRVAGVTRLEPRPEADGQFEFVADLEVFPEMPEIKVDDLAIERPEAEVQDSDVDDMIETLREQKRIWNAVERASKVGDRVKAAYVAEVDGERVPNTGRHEIAPVLGKLESFPELEGVLTGLSAGDKKSLEMSFPESYRHQALAGKKAQVELEIQAVEESELPEVDDAFAKEFGVEEGVDKLRADVRRNLERELRQTVSNRLKQAVTDGLLEHFGDIKLPDSSIQQEARQMLMQMQQQMGGQGGQLSPDMFREPAERRLRLGLLFGEFARQNEISIDPERVDAKLAEIADTYENPAQIMEIYRSDERLMDQLENLALEEQVVDTILDKAKVTAKSMSFKEVMEQE
ncbi:trigger factor [Wenzhouxiangella marina]|uniref:Trigger factor n=1 Tax=Wenzhouxiangella marina TaxID=1579979 RepID=A0A0K0XVI3_9GAMM|nr:trigger factor [Wenzhouxiangella marina]AKS41636.1 trigger factor [Wenzhouxiangella marina]MBB6086604.1 trigger factor [Wenzhouxiangella marina]